MKCSGKTNFFSFFFRNFYHEACLCWSRRTSKRRMSKRVYSLSIVFITLLIGERKNFLFQLAKEKNCKNFGLFLHVLKFVCCEKASWASIHVCERTRKKNNFFLKTLDKSLLEEKKFFCVGDVLMKK